MFLCHSHRTGSLWLSILFFSVGQEEGRWSVFAGDELSLCLIAHILRKDSQQTREGHRLLLAYLWGVHSQAAKVRRHSQSEFLDDTPPLNVCRPCLFSLPHLAKRPRSSHYISKLFVFLVIIPKAAAAKWLENSQTLRPDGSRNGWQQHWRVIHTTLRHLPGPISQGSDFLLADSSKMASSHRHIQPFTVWHFIAVFLCLVVDYRGAEGPLEVWINRFPAEGNELRTKPRAGVSSLLDNCLSGICDVLEFWANTLPSVWFMMWRRALWWSRSEAKDSRLRCKTSSIATKPIKRRGPRDRFAA